jgi:hypothetical protein
MTNKEILIKAIETIGVLGTAFGGVLLKVQPPGDSNETFSNFIGSFSALILLLIISALVRKIKDIYKFWIGLAIVSLIVFVVISLRYQRLWNRNTIAYPAGFSQRYVVGDQLSKFGRILDSNSRARGLLTDKYHLVENGGGVSKISVIWEDVNEKGEMMVTYYITLMAVLACAIFGLIEGIIGRSE